MIELYNKTAFGCSKLITNAYSTSFSLGIKTLHARFHEPVYAIYGFVRYADEIVDTFHAHDKKDLLTKFESETFVAIRSGISLNPVLHSFQSVINQYHIDHALIDAFLSSMKMDLDKSIYNDSLYKTYIYGSAEVVGLMCLKVFCEGNELLYEDLRPTACSLGAAFQKVNFLRDMESDYNDRGRVYFPDVDFKNFSENDKIAIEKDIEKDFADAYTGIIRLPKGSKLGVYLAYIYYLKLFKKIKRSSPSKLVSGRIRIPDGLKAWLLLQSYIKLRLNAL